MWRALAPLLAARRSTRIWSPDNGFDHTGRLGMRLPDRPTAVALYSRGRTSVLALDFDTKSRARSQVIAESTRVLQWIRECGGRPVVDESTSGGRHILVPLAHSATVDELRPVLHALADRCPTLDISPMLNPRTGCLTPPGSPCREGGHRTLLGDLSHAVAAFAERSLPHFLVTLAAHFAATAPCAPTHTGDDDAFFIGTGAHRRIRTELQRRDPLPGAVAAFAQAAAMAPDHRWHSRSEARQSVLTHALWRGYTLTDILTLTQPNGTWHHGLATAYTRYGPRARHALERDWTKAQHWLAQNLPKFHSATHKNKHTGGTYGGTAHRHWLANATLWCDTTHRSHPQRAATAAVLQALAVSAARAGTTIDGVPVVAVGGRSLSLATGLLSEATVWAILRRLRETPGAPILLVEKGTGLAADRYALTTPDITDPTPDAVGRPIVTDVHPAWAVIGHQHRRVYELLTRTQIRRPADLAAATHTAPSSLYDTLAELARVGLITRTHGHAQPTGLALDDIADHHHLDEEKAARISAHRAARICWRAWLSTRKTPPHPPELRATVPPRQMPSHYGEQPDDQQEYLSIVLATGPPA